ncbi:MAG: 50S ribosomal protein L10 [Candidatus Baltobacteraceae bacterium]|jgi:large subunit ribosomal protein L10
MPTAKKEQTIDALRKRLAAAKYLFFTNYAGLTVEEIGKLRDELRKDGSTYAVVKNTLFSIAAGEELAGRFEPFLKGPTGVIFAKAEPVAPAKALKHFSDTVRPLDVKAAYVDGKILGVKEIGALASLPPKAELQAKVVGLFASPLRNFVGLLAANPSGFVRVLSAREKQLAESASPSGD